MSGKGMDVVVPLQRDWLVGSGPLQRAAEAMLEAPHPAPARLGGFVRGELSREDNRIVVRHLLTGCPICSAFLRPLLGHARPKGRKP